jgi:type IV pilus assembly protein PilW
MNSTHMRSGALRADRGFTLVELMVTVTIGLFLVAGLLTLVQAMKRTSTMQSGMSQLQDNERMTTTLMTDVIQSGGYFPSPLVNSATSEFPITGSFTAAGQAIVGSGLYGAAAPGDSITVRYATAGGDGVINCSGGTSAVAATFTNQFSVDAFGNLNCVLTVTASTVTTSTIQLITGQSVNGVLVNGVTNMQIYYGVQTNTAAGNNSVDTYLDATAVTSGNYWANVISVKITLTFINPLSGQPGQTSTTIPFTRVVDVMQKTGVTT